MSAFIMSSAIDRILQLRNTGLLSMDETKTILKSNFVGALKDDTLEMLVEAVFNEQPPTVQAPVCVVESSDDELILTKKEFEGIVWLVNEDTGDVFGIAGEKPSNKPIGRLSVKKDFKRWLSRPAFLPDDE